MTPEQITVKAFPSISSQSFINGVTLALARNPMPKAVLEFKGQEASRNTVSDASTTCVELFTPVASQGDVTIKIKSTVFPVITVMTSGVATSHATTQSPQMIIHTSQSLSTSASSFPSTSSSHSLSSYSGDTATVTITIISTPSQTTASTTSLHASIIGTSVKPKSISRSTIHSATTASIKHTSGAAKASGSVNKCGSFVALVLSSTILMAVV